MGEFYYASFVEEEVPEEFTTWPLHITLLPRFELKGSAAKHVAEQVSERIGPFEIELGKSAMFGVAKDVPVRVIKPNQDLTTLHISLYEHADAAGAIFRHTRYSGENYNPHITTKRKRAKHLPKHVTVDSISLVERHQKGKRRLVETYKLTGKTHGKAKA